MEQQSVDVEKLAAELPPKVVAQKTYGGPAIVDLGKASELLQGGACNGRDNSYATYCR